MFRLRQKHSRHSAAVKPAEIAPTVLIEAQSVRDGILGGLAALVLVHLCWAYSAVLLDRVFPWMTIVQGALIGMGVQRLGRGLDWRFPLIAALWSFPASFTGNLVVALSLTANAAGVAIVDVIAGLSASSLQKFYSETITSVDIIFAFCSIALATFFAKRRLTRQQANALHKYELEQSA